MRTYKAPGQQIFVISLLYRYFLITTVYLKKCSQERNHPKRWANFKKSERASPQTPEGNPTNKHPPQSVRPCELNRYFYQFSEIGRLILDAENSCIFEPRMKKATREGGIGFGYGSQLSCSQRLSPSSPTATHTTQSNDQAEHHQGARFGNTGKERDIVTRPGAVTDE